jgi:WhiB family redox-sensing transcriptional regulator
MTYPNWMNDAPCKGKGDMFFDEVHRTIVREAQKICAKCEFKVKCLDYALKHEEVGVWAGTTTNQRAKILRSHRKERKKAEHYTQAV